jgi:hypothetical protein
MKLTKAQKEILEQAATPEGVLNASQRMKSLRPLIEAGLIREVLTYGPDGFLACGPQYFLV